MGLNFVAAKAREVGVVVYVPHRTTLGVKQDPAFRQEFLSTQPKWPTADIREGSKV